MEDSRSIHCYLLLKILHIDSRHRGTFATVWRESIVAKVDCGESRLRRESSTPNYPLPQAIAQTKKDSIDSQKLEKMSPENFTLLSSYRKNLKDHQVGGLFFFIDSEIQLTKK